MSNSRFTGHLKPAKQPLDYDVYIAVKDGVADSIWSNSFMGLSTWDADTKSWEEVTKGDPKLTEWRTLTTYAIDWEKLQAFDENDKFIGYELFAKGELTEQWLKGNAKIAWVFSTSASAPGENK